MRGFPKDVLLPFVVALSACGDGRAPQIANDPYAKVELKSPPARVTQSNLKGGYSYAEGAALNMGAELKPAGKEDVKTVRLDTTHKLIEIQPGVKFTAWTFGDQVPGPTVRARVGDRIKFVMTNRSDEPVGRPEIVTAPMMHSMDFHAAMVSPQDKYRSIAPGQTIEFEFVANYPGVFMYHCGTPMVLEHIASGMYGAVIIDPKEGYPGKADREYMITQSEFYTKPDPQKRQVDGQVVHVLDTEKLRASQPNHTVFNGHHDHLVGKPLPAKPGERVRLFVLNVGPSKTSSFHVVGTIFDKVWIEGNPANQFRGMQTVLLGSSNSAVVEFMIPEEGAYVMVDHHFANASQGAIGLIDASGGKAAKAEQEHHNLPASAAPSDPEALQAKTNFESKCVACHAITGGEGKKIGPDLLGVTRRRDEKWLARFLKAPEQMFQTDATAKELLAKYKVPMPNQNLSDEEIRGYIKYFRFNDEAAKPAAKPVAKK
jgi:nitrite reductase (NO-forming)